MGSFFGSSLTGTSGYPIPGRPGIGGYPGRPGIAGYPITGSSGFTISGSSCFTLSGSSFFPFSGSSCFLKMSTIIGSLGSG